ENVRKAFDAFNNIKIQTQSFTLIPPDEIKSVETAKENIIDLAIQAETNIEKLPKTIKGFADSVNQISAFNKINNDLNKIVGTTKNVSENFVGLTSNIYDLGIEAIKSIKDLNPSQEGIRTSIRRYKEILETVTQIRKQLQIPDSDNFLEDVLTQARKNLDAFTEEVADAQSQGMFLNSTIMEAQRITLDTLKGIYEDVFNDIVSVVWIGIEPIKNWIVGIIEYWGLVPEHVAKVLKIVAALIVLIGLMNTQMMGVYLTTSYWVALWNSNLVVMGMTRAISLVSTLLMSTAGLTAAQIGLNIATAFYVALWALLLVAVIAIVAALAYIVQYFVLTTESAEEAARRTKQLEEATERYKNHLKEITDLYKNQLDMIEKIREAALTPEQKAAQKTTELQTLIDMPTKLDEKIINLQDEIRARKFEIQSVKDVTWFDSSAKELVEQNEAAKKTLKELLELQSKIEPLTEIEIEVRRQEIIKMEMEDRGIAKFLPDFTPMENALNAISNLDEMFDAGKIKDRFGDVDVEKYDVMFENIVEDLKKSMGIVKAPLDVFDESLKNLTTQIDQLAESMQNAGNILDDNELAKAKQVLLDNLKKDLKIDKYFENVETSESRAELIRQLQSNIELYAERANLTKEEIDVARQKMQNEILSKTVYAKYLDTTSKSDELLNAYSTAKSDRTNNIINTEQLKIIQDNLDSAVRVMFKIESPVTSFDGLVKELDKFKNTLKPDELAQARQKLIDQLRGDLGLDKYFDLSETTAERAKLIKTMEENINIYAQKANELGIAVDANAAISNNYEVI
ncbi:MAG: hypothetical protein LBP59_00170, partial [Planctomycetaceae bacterium]|nr:hypothetical protein [Planctomycetaceae bacterium]